MAITDYNSFQTALQGTLAEYPKATFRLDTRGGYYLFVTPLPSPKSLKAPTTSLEVLAFRFIPSMADLPSNGNADEGSKVNGRMWRNLYEQVNKLLVGAPEQTPQSLKTLYIECSGDVSGPIFRLDGDTTAFGNNTELALAGPTTLTQALHICK